VTTLLVTIVMEERLVYFALELDPIARLSTHPTRVDRDGHWRNPVRVIGRLLAVRAGDRFTVHYRDNVPESGVSVARG